MIIITGASDGLGAALVAVAKKVGEKTTNISRHMSDSADENIIADLSDVRQIKEAAAKIRSICFPKALILNAGVLSLTSLKDIDESEYERVMNVNLRAPVLLVAELFEWLVTKGVDVIIVNSIAGLRSFKGQIVYDISKWGLRGFTEDLRLELSDTKCRVIGVYPGMLDTNIASKLPSGPLPKSSKPTISSHELATMILQAIMQPKSMQVSDLVIDRKV
ncbi:MAG: SDR family NAD(P)-dependent oxidoreductase [Candidatus Saccharimonas sp.]